MIITTYKGREIVLEESAGSFYTKASGDDGRRKAYSSLKGAKKAIDRAIDEKVEEAKRRRQVKKVPVLVRETRYESPSVFKRAMVVRLASESRGRNGKCYAFVTNLTSRGWSGRFGGRTYEIAHQDADGPLDFFEQKDLDTLKAMEKKQDDIRKQIRKLENDIEAIDEQINEKRIIQSDLLNRMGLDKII